MLRDPAFLADPAPHKPRAKRETDVFRDDGWLVELRDHACIITGMKAHDGESVVPMHIGTYGKGIKSPDNEALPVLNRFHQSGHNGGEISMLRQNIPDWLLRDALRAYAREYHAKHRGR